MSEIIDCSGQFAGPAPQDRRCQVAIVGSGCGGATAAMLLAEAGKDVILLEEGGDFVGPAKLTQRDLPMYDQLYADRGGRTTTCRSISVLSGRVLGGGGVINASDVVPIAAETWQTWRDHYSITEFAAAEITRATEQALADLSARPISEDQVNRNNQVLRRGARALGWRGELMLHNRDGCKGLGTCLIGCPVGAKRNPRMVAIPRALAAGAQVLVRARVKAVRNATMPEKTLQIACLDERGYREGNVFRVIADTVILAAGPVGTTTLLERAGLGGPALGRFVSLQPQVPITAVMPEVVGGYDGIPQAFAITEFERHDPQLGLSGFRIEPIFGTPGILGSLVSQPGADGKQLLAQLPHFAASLLLLPDESRARIHRNWAGQLRIDYEFTEDYRRRARQAIAAAGRAYLAAGATLVAVPNAPPVILRSEGDLPSVAALSLAPATIPLISAHQQGGARMGVDPERSVCDQRGRVHGSNSVYVMDTSLFPTSASSHTMAPTVTIAHLLAGRLAAGR